MQAAQGRRPKGFMPQFVAAAFAFFAVSLSAREQTIATQEIDRQIAAYLGHPVGIEGGASRPLDARLNLAACPLPIAFDWHGVPGRNLIVSCPRPGGWRIFVHVRQPTRAANAQSLAVKRGEAITLQVRGRGFSIQSRAEARESGAMGDWIKVRTAKSAQPVSARIERPGLAIIDTK